MSNLQFHNTTPQGFALFLMLLFASQFIPQSPPQHQFYSFPTNHLASSLSNLQCVFYHIPSVCLPRYGQSPRRIHDRSSCYQEHNYRCCVLLRNSSGNGGELWCSTVGVTMIRKPGISSGVLRIRILIKWADGFHMMNSSAS